MAKNQLITACFISFLFMVSTNSYAQSSGQITENANNISANLIKKYESIKLRIVILEAKVNKTESLISRNQTRLKEVTSMIDGLKKRIASRDIEKEIRKQLRDQLEEYKEKTIPLETQLNLLDIQLPHEKKELEEALKEKSDLESKHPFLLERQVAEEPILHDIEVINIKTGEHNLKVKLGEKIQLKAIPHSYTPEGDNVGKKISNFKPDWSTPYGTFVPDYGSDVLYIVPNNLDGVVTYWIEVEQKNSEGRLIKAKIRIGIVKE